MKIIRRNQKNFHSELTPLLERSAFSSDIDRQVADILADVRQRGDAALCDCALKFDHVSLTPEQFMVTAAECAAAGKSITADVRQAITAAVQQVADFASQRRPENWSYSPRPGVTLGEQFSPMSRVGCYIPGGTAPLISTVVHTVTLAATAGVPEIVVITPPGKDAQVNPALLYACQVAGATEIYRLGGVYGIAALAYGSASIRRVEKIVGPGNSYVTAAKRQVYGQVALDLVAGPSEIMIIADESANPAYIAADMLSQAEHGSGREQAVLLSTEPALLPQVAAELQRQSACLSRSDCLAKVLANGVFLLETASLQEAVELANRYAPEHLELMLQDPEPTAARITAAGAIFLGHWTPEPVGDFVAGPSHVLPTGGSGRFFTGLTAEMFFRRSSLVKYDRTALERELPYIRCFAASEGLDAHGNSAAIRLT
ncbi:MAG: histidinol dehydrogenase [Oligosphaeraceae bacterium]|nr:histidinol dehydrogenase [Oligosphaeraceae bacterium]